MVTPLSSRNFSFSGEIVATAARNSTRRLRLASVSAPGCGATLFQPQTHLVKDLTDAALAHRYSLRVQLFAQFGQRAARLLRTQSCNCSLTAAVTRLKSPCRDCGWRSIRPHNRRCRRILRTYSKLTPKHRDNSALRSLSAQVGLQYPATQIVGKRLRHPRRFSQQSPKPTYRRSASLSITILE